jgi:energy-coupling factor transporter ATP-binding protein EcfA2
MKTAHQRGGARPSGRSLSAESGLLEREVELEAVAAMIDLSSDKGQLLVIEGPPGIGKTSLLVEARALAREAGLEVLSARGSELELEFSHGVVRQLFEPCLGRLPEEEHAEVLAGAASLASPLFDPVQLRSEPAMDVSLATLHGLYWLTANVAARRPLLLAIDDLHWCDAASLRWLAYLVARMEDLPLALVAALRSAEQGTDPVVLGQLVSDPLATVVRPAPLTAAATGRLVRQPVDGAGLRGGLLLALIRCGHYPLPSITSGPGSGGMSWPDGSGVLRAARSASHRSWSAT